jgi:2-hydroxychromene-2-carboxylate isomerase
MTTIEYFYAAHSAFAYIGSALFMDIARRGGCRVVHRPYDLRGALASLGPGATGSLTPARSAYFFGREIERAAEFRNVPILPRIPTHHANDIHLPNAMLVAAAELGSADRLAHAVLRAHWVDDADLADPETLLTLADSNNCNGADLLAAAKTAAVQARYAVNTRDAIARSVFGSPTYVVDGDPFYGQDRLEQVARAIERPFARRWQGSA